jgi:cytochrome c556
MTRFLAAALIAATPVAAATLFAQAPVEKPPEAYQKLMQQVGPTNQAIAKKVEAKDHGGIAADAASLRKVLADVEAFWKARKAEAAVKFAVAAQAAATELETAAKAMSDSGIAAARKTLGAQCMGCHTAHRDKMADGTWGIKY